MEKFSYQYPSSEFDSFLVPNAATNISCLPELGTRFTTQTCFNPTLLASNEYFGQIPWNVQIHETSPLDKSCTANVPFAANPSLKRKQEPNSSPMVANGIASGDQVTPTLTSMEKKRKHEDIKVQKEDKDEKEKKRGIKSRSKKQNKETEKAPTGYVHVRARRGEATDSHSLAERVRRAKISEKMKLLQSLVPGCDKLTGKALILEEIIQYVRALQNQVEFLSAKLASVTPMYNDFELDFDTRPLPQEDNGNWGTDGDGWKQELPYNQYGFDNFLFNV